MTINFNISGWEQQEVNMLHAILSMELYADGVTHNGIKCLDGVCSIENPSGAFSYTEEHLLGIIKNEIAKQKELALIEEETL